MNAPDDNERMHDEAARWTALLDGGSMTADQYRELNRWLAEDDGRKLLFDRYQRVAGDAARKIAVLSPGLPAASPRRRSRRRPWMLAAAGAAAVLAAAAAWIVPAQFQTQTVATRTAQRSTVVLADGSHAELNARSELSSDFRSGKRRLRLTRGEAYFSVATDAGRPFEVLTPSGTVKVLGTSFNVRLDEEGRMEVTLLSGRVIVTPPASSEGTLLSPGQQYSGQGRLRELSVHDLESAVAWREGRIDLNRMTLAEAAARYGTFHGKSVTVDPSVASLRLGGSYELDNLQSFFDVLQEDTLRLHVVRRADGSYRITGR